MVGAQQEIEQAKTLAREGNSQGAITVLSKLIQVEAGNAEAWLALAQVVEEPDRIEFCLQKVLKLDAGNPTALDMLSETKGGSLSVGSVSGLGSGADKLEEKLIAPAARAAPKTHRDSTAGAEYHGAPAEDKPDNIQGLPDAPVEEEGISAPDPASNAEDAERVMDRAALEIDERAAQPEAALGAQDESAQRTRPRWSFGRTDLILVGLTVLAGLVLCGLVGAAIVRNLASF